MPVLGILVIVLLTACGTQVVALLSGVRFRAGDIGLGYMLGTGLFTFVMFVGNLVGVPYALAPVLFLAAGFFAFLCAIPWFLKGRGPGVRPSPRIVVARTTGSNYARGVEVLWFAAFACVSAFIVAFGSVVPIKDWDSFAMYDFRARSFVATGGMADAIGRGYFFGYPLYTSLLHAIGYLSGFRHVTFLHGLMYVALIGTCLSVIREFSGSRALSLLAALAVMVSPGLLDQSMSTYTNLGYAVYYTLSLLTGGLAMKRQAPRYFLVSALLLGLAGWTRTTEPFWLPVLLLLVLGVLFDRLVPLKRRVLSLGAVVLLATLPRLAWKAFTRQQFAAVADPAARTGSGVDYLSLVLDPKHYNVQQFSTVMEHLDAVVFKPQKEIFLFFAFCAALALIRRCYRQPFLGFLLAASMMNLAGLVVGTFFFSYLYTWWGQIVDSLTRMMFALYPALLIFSVCVLFHEMRCMRTYLRRDRDREAAPDAGAP